MVNILIFVYLFSYLFFFRRGEGVSGSEKVSFFFFLGGGGGYVDFCDIFVGVFSVEKKELFINFGNCWYFLGCMLGNSGIFWWFTVKLAILRGRVNAEFQHMYK